MGFFRGILKFLFFFILLPAALYARDITITVEDQELGLPLEGAVVSLRNGEQFVCDEDGRATVSLSDNRQQVVQISYPGYDTSRVSIPPAESGVEHLTVALRLSGVMQGRELVLEAQRPETSETKSGRSVAISERELERTAEIGIIEDVMKSIKLLPGVGYTGMFGAMPSIRGGDPGDLMAALDGFYLERPYHWVGAVSIFDPKMVSSARLSHGVFSSRYGHTISGLLEVTSKSPSPTETELEAGISTSAASINLSYPLGGGGGVLFMGKVSYWDTLVWTMQGLSRIIENETLDMINSVSTAPYIRSAALSANYRFGPNLEWRLNSFFGSDGVGASYKNNYNEPNIKGRMEMAADYNNYQGFLISGLTASPTPKLALRFTAGAGFIETITEDMVDNNVTVKYNDTFWKYLDSFFDDSPYPLPSEVFKKGDEYTAPDVNASIKLESTVFTAQTRADVDWELGNGFIAALGVQELYSLWGQKGDIGLNFVEVPVDRLMHDAQTLQQLGLDPALIGLIQYLGNIPNMAIIRPMGYNLDVRNHGLTTSGYGLVEYTSPNQFIGMELGLRLDHLYFMGKDFTTQTKPALNPRFNIDFGLLKNRGMVDSLGLTLGTGLFSSIDKLISFMNKDFLNSKMDLQFNRSWTSVIGVKVDMAQSYSFNIEGYYKYVFDRASITADIASGSDIKPGFKFDGIGNVWGIDLQLQKLESRYIDGWVSYSFNWAKYYDPPVDDPSGDQGLNMGRTGNMRGFWYWPSFHRFHNANIVLNFKPLQWFNIAARFGFASGQPRNKVSKTVEPYPVLTIDKDNNAVIMQKYRRDSWYDENERSSWSLPLDVKFSFFLFDRKGRVGTEIYLAAENLLSLVYSPAGNVRFNEYTGKEDTTGSGNFDFPIPMASFGFKWRY
ncbi:MAG: hypothetical protein LBH20_05320 [Treponema sp.]|nr:hypothetical protein [Treponema sp.]